MIKHKTFFTGLLVAIAFFILIVQVKAADHENPEAFAFHNIIAAPFGSTFVYTYSPVLDPELHVSPPFMKPVGVSIGSLFRVSVASNGWSGLVDIYGAYTVSTDPGAVYILNPNGSSFTRVTMQDVLNTLNTGNLPQGVGAWKEGIVSSVFSNLVNAPIANIPSGTYTAYFMVTAANTFSTYYLWVTTFVIP